MTQSFLLRLLTYVPPSPAAFLSKCRTALFVDGGYMSGHVDPRPAPHKRRAVCCVDGGYMSGFMETLNRTWPHPHHLYLNLGRGGSNLELLTEATCLDANIPTQVTGVR